MRIIKPKFSVHVTRLSYSLVLAKNKKMCKKTQEDEANSTTTKQIALPLLAKQQLFASKKRERRNRTRRGKIICGWYLHEVSNLCVQWCEGHKVDDGIVGMFELFETLESFSSALL